MANSRKPLSGMGSGRRELGAQARVINLWKKLNLRLTFRSSFLKKQFPSLDKNLSLRHIPNLFPGFACDESTRK